MCSRVKFEFMEMVTYLFRYCYAVSLVIMAMMQLHFLRKIHDATLEAQV